jgi:hypothetical protein
MPASQLFKQKIQIENLFVLLDDICVKKEDYYEINNVSFRKGVYNNSIVGFFERCKPYYHKSKLKYLEKPITYNSFITVIRQICNSNDIIYKSSIKYDKTKYDIIYRIYFNVSSNAASSP